MSQTNTTNEIEYMDRETLKQYIKDRVYQNENNEITGLMNQEALLALLQNVVLWDEPVDPEGKFVLKTDYNADQIIVNNKINGNTNNIEINAEAIANNKSELDGVDADLQNQIDDIDDSVNDLIENVNTGKIYWIKGFVNIGIPTADVISPDYENIDEFKEEIKSLGVSKSGFIGFKSRISAFGVPMSLQLSNNVTIPVEGTSILNTKGYTTDINILIYVSYNGGNPKAYLAQYSYGQQFDGKVQQVSLNNENPSAWIQTDSDTVLVDSSADDGYLSLQNLNSYSVAGKTYTIQPTNNGNPFRIVYSPSGIDETVNPNEIAIATYTATLSGYEITVVDKSDYQQPQVDSSVLKVDCYLPNIPVKDFYYSEQSNSGYFEVNNNDYHYWVGEKVLIDERNEIPGKIIVATISKVRAISNYFQIVYDNAVVIQDKIVNVQNKNNDNPFNGIYIKSGSTNSGQFFRHLNQDDTIYTISQGEVAYFKKNKQQFNCTNNSSTGIKIDPMPFLQGIEENAQITIIPPSTTGPSAKFVYFNLDDQYTKTFSFDKIYINGNENVTGSANYAPYQDYLHNGSSRSYSISVKCRDNNLYIEINPIYNASDKSTIAPGDTTPRNIVDYDSDVDLTGSSTKYSRADHTHKQPLLLNLQDIQGTNRRSTFIGTHSSGGRFNFGTFGFGFAHDDTVVDGTDKLKEWAESGFTNGFEPNFIYVKQNRFKNDFINISVSNLDAATGNDSVAKDDNSHKFILYADDQQTRLSAYSKDSQYYHMRPIIDGGKDGDNHDFVAIYSGSSSYTEKEAQNAKVKYLIRGGFDYSRFYGPSNTIILGNHGGYMTQLGAGGSISYNGLKSNGQYGYDSKPDAAVHLRSSAYDTFVTFYNTTESGITQEKKTAEWEIDGNTGHYTTHNYPEAANNVFGLYGVTAIGNKFASTYINSASCYHNFVVSGVGSIPEYSNQSYFKDNYNIVVENTFNNNICGISLVKNNLGYFDVNIGDNNMTTDVKINGNLSVNQRDILNEIDALKSKINELIGLLTAQGATLPITINPIS